MLNIRRGPGVSFEDIGDTKQGTEWMVFERAGDWARIGLNAWVHAGYTEKVA
jgi:uncharacterized protein YgiM (DUF1202 family)